MNSVFHPNRIARVCTCQTPFFGISACLGRGWTLRSDIVDYEGKEGWESRGVDNATSVEVAIEGILIGCARIISDFYATGMSRGVVVNVEIRGFVETV